MADRNPFAVAERPQDNQSVGVATATQRELTEVQSAMVVAKQSPRDELEKTERILKSCRRPTLAESAIYSYPRGGSTVTGPSIRLAEALAQNWGNLTFGIRELEQEDGASTVEAYAWDLETNTRASKVFRVPHIRSTKKGPVKLTDPRDIYEHVANQGARRLRACILSVIPGDVVDAAVHECEQTQRAQVGDPQAAGKKMVEAFQAYGVTRKQIEQRLGHHLDSVSAAEILNLRKLYASIKDQMVSVGEVFPPDAQGPKTSAKEKVLGAATAVITEQGEDSAPTDDTAQADAGAGNEEETAAPATTGSPSKQSDAPGGESSGKQSIGKKQSTDLGIF